MNPYAEAMLRFINLHAKQKKRVGKYVRFNGWWREGSSLSCSLDTTSGMWRDFATCTGGGAKEFARVLGMSMAQLMGDIDARSYKPPPAPPPPQEVDGVPESWAALEADASAHRALAWLSRRRGFGELAAATRSGVAYADDANLHCWATPRLSSFVAWRVRECGPHIVFPIRDPYAPGVLNLGLRPLGGGERRFIPGAFVVNFSTKVPRVYGLADRIHQPERLVVTEGAVDTLVVEACTPPETGVVGITSVSMMTPLVGALTTRPTASDTVLVPQLDPPRYGPVEKGKTLAQGEQSQRAMAKALRVLQHSGHRVRVFNWDLVLERMGEKGDGVKDIGDVLQRMGAATGSALVAEGLGEAWA